MPLAFAARLLANATDPIMNSRRVTEGLEFAITPPFISGLFDQCITSRAGAFLPSGQSHQHDRSGERNSPRPYGTRTTDWGYSHFFPTGRRRRSSNAVGGEAAYGLACGYVLAGEDDGVAADAGAGTDDGGDERYLIEVFRVMGVGIDAGEGADDGALADGNAAAVVQAGRADGW